MIPSNYTNSSSEMIVLYIRTQMKDSYCFTLPDMWSLGNKRILKILQNINKFLFLDVCLCLSKSAVLILGTASSVVNIGVGRFEILWVGVGMG